MDWCSYYCIKYGYHRSLELYEVLKKYKIITALHKFYSLSELKYYENNKNEKLDPNYFMISTGMSDANYENLCEILKNIDCKWICIDIANGYLNQFVEY